MVDGKVRDTIVSHNGRERGLLGGIDAGRDGQSETNVGSNDLLVVSGLKNVRFRVEMIGVFWIVLLS